MNRQRIERPPFLHNWARYNFPDVDKTAKAILQFYDAKIPISYVAASKIAEDIVRLGLDSETAIKAARTRGRPNSRKIVEDFIRALLKYNDERRFSGMPQFDQFIEPYRVSRSIYVPVKPLSIVAENGRLKAIFLFPWATVPFNEFQRRLIMTVLEDAIFSLSDFRNADAELVFFPKEEIDGVAQRVPEVWQRGQYELLSNAELIKQHKIYLDALDRVRSILDARPHVEKKPERKPGLIIDPAQKNIFDE